MAAPSYFHSASNPADNGTGADGSTLAITPPGSMAAGDLVIMIGLVQVNASSAISISATGGQSWTQLNNAFASDLTVSTWWCQFNGTWSTNPSLAFASQSGTQPATAMMHVFRPNTVGSGNWVLDQNVTSATFPPTGAANITGITNGKSDTATLAGWFIPSASTFGSLSGSGWSSTEVAQYRNTSGTDQTASFAYKCLAAAGSTGDVSKTPSPSAGGVYIIASWSFQFAPTVTLSSPGNGNTVTDTTPDLVFVGADSNSDDLDFEINIDTSNQFNSVPIGYNLKYVDLGLNKTGSPTDNLYLDVCSGSPSGTVLGTSNVVAASSVPASGNASTKFTFATPITLSASTTYYIVLRRTGARDTSNYVYWGRSNSSSFVGGSFIRNSNVWSSEDATWDFTIIVTDDNDIIQQEQNSQNNTVSVLGGTASSGESNQMLGQSFTVSLAEALIKKNSVDHSGFAGSGGDTRPFTQNTNITYTVQSALSETTYYWRVRAKDPSGTNVWGAWSSTYSFIVSSGSSAKIGAFARATQFVGPGGF